MCRDGQLMTNRRNEFALMDKMSFIKGRVIGHRDGFGFVKPEDGSDDLKLSPRQMRQVFDGDQVLVQETNVDFKGRREGKIIEIRKNKAVVNFNGLSTTVNVKDLLKAIQEKRPEIKKSKRVVTINDVEKTFDVRGLMQDSARVQIEGYFDQALLNNIETIKIIHGKGTGALRNLVKSLVREYKTNILEWKFEEEKRGGDGATIITFK